LSEDFAPDGNQYDLILANAGRLRDDAQFLLDNSRFASAYALAVLSVEEIGRVVLSVWGIGDQLSHLHKQAAVCSVLVALYAMKQFPDVFTGKVAQIPDDMIETITQAFNDSDEGKLLHLIINHTFNKSKQRAMYQDEWPTPVWGHFGELNVQSIFEIGDTAMSACPHEDVVRLGRIIFTGKKSELRIK
jgi:AbiV family abortive infection protein